MLAQIIFYLAFYIIGVTLGSFFTLAIYRIPLKQDILYTRSYCPKCNNKLKAKDLIPILSYIFLKGKCRYCKEKISPRYIIIEIFSGLFYLLFVLSLKIDIFNIEIFKIIKLIYGTFVISIFFIIGGIEKETGKFSNGTVVLGLFTSLAYIIYLYILGNNIYRYIIYIVAIILILVLQKLMKTKKYKNLYNIIILALFSLIATNEIVFISSALCALAMYLVRYIITKNKKINYIFYFCFLNIIFLIINNFILIK